MVKMDQKVNNYVKGYGQNELKNNNYVRRIWLK